MACGKIREDEKAVPELIAVQVEVVKAAQGEIYEELEFWGDIRGEREVTIFPKVPGKLSRKIKTAGDTVKVNEPIAYIDRDEPAMDFAEAEVRSPIDGTISHYYVDIGESVFPGQTPIAIVTSLNRVVVEIYATKKELTRMFKGQKARIKIDALAGRVFHGKITEIEPLIDPVTRKSKVEIVVENRKGLLKAGIFATVEIITKTHRNIVVPKTAVLERLDKEVVFVVDKENRAKIVPVVTGIRAAEKIEIKSGLKEGEKVIFKGNYALSEGTKVKVLQ